jgi:hypothetical protein
MALAPFVVGELEIPPGMEFYESQSRAIAVHGTLLLGLDALMLVYFVGLAHAASTVRGSCVLRTTAVGLAALAMATAAAMHTLYLMPLGSVGTPADAAGLPDQGVVTMLSDLQWAWLSPALAPLIGAALLALGALLWRSHLGGARSLGGAYAVAGLFGFIVLAAMPGEGLLWLWSTLLVTVLVLWTVPWLVLRLRAEHRRGATSASAPALERVPGSQSPVP